MSEINLIGLASNLENEDRALAYLQVSHNNNNYNWEIFIPNNVENINEYLEERKQSILDDIDAKELLWTNLEPKTKTITDPLTGDNLVIDIDKSEIVKPNIPDYYCLRKKEYPSIGDQLDAFWKGTNSQDYINMQNKIVEVKAKYPKL
jgi:hypothetical protein